MANKRIKLTLASNLVLAINAAYHKACHASEFHSDVQKHGLLNCICNAGWKKQSKDNNKEKNGRISCK